MWKSEELRHLAFNYANDGILVVVLTEEGVPGKFIEVNDHVCQLTGYSKKELLNLSPLDIDRTPPDKVRKVMEELFQNHHIIFETIMVTKKGDEIPIEISNHLIESEKSGIIISVIRDITDRIRAESALKKSEARNKALINTIPDMIFRISMDGIFLDYKSAKDFPPLTSPNEIIGGKIHEIMPEDVAQGAMDHVGKALQTGEMQIFNYQLMMEGNPNYFEARIIKSGTDEVTAIVRDISKQIRLEEQILQATKLEAIGTLTGGIAHDFNNMLNTIIGCAELLNDKMPQKKVLRSYVDMINVTAERAANLTQSLLAYSRKQLIECKPIDLNTTIHTIEKLLSRFIGEDIETEMNFTEKPLFILADRHQIEQVFMNLALNAKDAMPDGGDFIINTEVVMMDHEFIKVHGYGEPGEYAKITVTDSGLGMDEATMKRIFEPFFTTKEYGGGTGLGLAVIYGIIRQNNGYIDVYSELGEGTTFSIFLPLIDQAIKEQAVELDLPIRYGTETVLLAEDDETIRWLLKSALEQYNYTVIKAVDGEDAISEFAKNKDDINLSLLDVIMPKKNGIEVYEAIKKFKPDSKVVFMSGYPADYLEKKGLRKKEILISKPVAPSVVLRTIRDVLDK
jgi:PAS domain S-box-containing protein